MTASIAKIDHIAITTLDLDAMTGFYAGPLGGEVVNEYAIGGPIMIRQVRLGGAMLNIHRAGHGHPLVAASPTPGAVDLCFRWNGPIAAATAFLAAAGIAVIEGPAPRDASDGRRGMSVYFRDPDGNLLEFLSTWESGTG